MTLTPHPYLRAEVKERVQLYIYSTLGPHGGLYSEILVDLIYWRINLKKHLPEYIICVVCAQLQCSCAVTAVCAQLQCSCTVTAVCAQLQCSCAVTAVCAQLQSSCTVTAACAQLQSICAVSVIHALQFSTQTYALHSRGSTQLHHTCSAPSLPKRERQIPFSTPSTVLL